MLTRLQGRSLQFPLPSVHSRHHLSAGPFRPILTTISDDYVEIFSPLCTVSDRKLQFHKPYFHAKIQKNNH